MSDKGRTTVLSTGPTTGATASPSTSAMASGGGATSSSDVAAGGGVKYRHEEIISCISALDEVLAQFDDSSLPYISEYETSCVPGTDSSLPTTTTNDKSSLDAVVPKQVSRHNNSTVALTTNDNSNIAKSDAGSSPLAHSSKTSLVNVSGGGISTSSTSINNNKVIDQNQNLDWNSTRLEEESGLNDNRSSNHHNNNSPVINTSHLIQIPVVESVSVSSSTSSPRMSSQSQSKQNQKQKGGGGGLVTVSPYSQKYSSNCNKSKKKNANQMSASSASSSSSSPAPITAISVAPSSGIVEMNGNISSSQNKVSQHDNNGKGVAAAAAAAIGGGTYSKGTSYEILIPKITSGNFNRDSSVSCGKGTITTSSHSNRASIMVPVIESQPEAPSSSCTSTTSSAPAQQGIVSGNVAKIRSQLNMGIFQPNQPQLQQMVVHHQPKDNTFHTTLVPVSQMDPVEMGSRESPIMQQQHQQNSNGKFMKEAASNMNTGPSGVSSTYITVSEGKSSLGQSSSSGVSSSLATMMMMKGCDEEQWNFPSEKNLPRSLRKTRKTCFLDDDNATDPKLAKAVRSESPFCCSESSNNGMSSSTIDHSDRSDHGSTSCYMGEVNGGGGGSGRGHHQKSPRVIPRKGIPGKCEIINKGDGNFALAESSSARKIWNGQGQQQPHTTVVSTTSPYSSPVPNEQNHNRRKKIYEDVVLASQNSSSPKSRRELPVSIQNSNVVSSSSPSSTFTSSSGVSLSVTSNHNTFVDGDSFDGKNHGHHGGGLPSSKSRKSHQNPVHEQQQQQMIPKPRIRQQIPSPGTEVPIPANHFMDLQNQFIPQANIGRSSDCEMNVYPSEVSCIPVPMSSHHSPINSVEIGTEQDELRHGCDQELEYDEDFEDDIGDVSSNTSPIKTCHPDILMRNKSSDTDFEETASDSKVLEKTRRTSGAGGGKRGRSRISKPAFGEGQNGSLPNQSQMMRMMMMMKGTGKNNSVGSASSSSRSSSSSGSVSVKSSSSSENNCGDVFHENIVQDYPTNIFTVGGADNNASGEEQASYGSSPGNDNSEGNVSKGSKEGTCLENDKLNGIDKNESNDGRRTITTNGAVVVLRGRGRTEGRGNMQLANKQPIFAGATVGSQQQQQNNTTLEIDDGYLSMINRNEAPLYWPEEFIENETFSKAELKRLSVTLNEDTDVEDENGRSTSRSPSQNMKIDGVTESKIGKGNFAGHHDRISMSSSSNTGGSIAHPPQRKGGRRANATSMAGRSSTEKTDYFSDDSLEGEEREFPNNSGERVVVRAATSFVIPFNTTENDEIILKTASPNNQVKKSNSQVSRIPKPTVYSNANLGRNNSTKDRIASGGGGGNGHQNDNTSPTFPKPCSFFIPFSSEVQGNLSSATGGGSDRKLSAGDTGSSGRNVANNLMALMADPLRSTSLPSSRRNSSSSNNADVAKKQPVAWSISTATTSTDDKKSRQQTDKASIDTTTYVDTDLHYQSSDIRSQQGASSSSKSSSIINNKNNKANIIPGPTDSLLCNKENFKSNNCSQTEKNSSVTITTKNISDDHHDDQKKVLIVGTSNDNDDKSIFATTKITCPANSNSALQQAHESSAGGSVSKRHKFEKQQTFILSPSPSNSSDTCNISVAQQLGQKQIGQDDKAKVESESNNDLTKTIVDGNPKTMTTTTTSSSSSQSNFVSNQQQLKNKEDEKNCSESQKEVLDLWEKISDNSSDKKLAVRDDQGSSKRNVSELNKNNTSTSIFTGTGKGSTSIDQVDAAASQSENEVANAKEVEDHHSASEELESVVKMFLKATEGLLDPEENNGEKMEKDNVKSCTTNSSKTDQKKREHRENVSIFHTGNDMMEDTCSFDEIVNQKPLMTSTPIGKREQCKNETSKDDGCGSDKKRLSFLLVSDPRDDDSIIEGLEEQPPTFIPEPPPATSMVDGDEPGLKIVASPNASVLVGDSVHPAPAHNLDGKVALDLLSQRITRNCPSPVESMSVSQFLHNKKNIWAMYDRPYDEDVLPPSFPRGYASRSQENLIDAMTHERLTKSFSARGQSSTLPLNCRPPPVQRRTSTFRNMFNKFRKHKTTTTDTVIHEGPEIRDDEAQSITSRETGPSEGKKRGFFSRLFRRSRKH